MRSVANYLVIMFSVMLFIFRLILVFCASIEVTFVMEPINMEYEIILLFVMIPSIILLSKNKIIGPIIFVISSALYYGQTLYNQLTHIIGYTADSKMILEFVISSIGVLIPLASFVTVFLAKKQERKPVDEKTDFFYKNEEYDRKLDERADKNNYRIM